jgi:hypothetical protein
VAQASTNVTLSDEAKAYLANLAEAVSNSQAPAETLATNARAWFDQQYKDLGISSAVLDGKVAVDLTGQSRATLSAVASNTLGLFTPDETTAASNTLQTRFYDAIVPQVVIARHMAITRASTRPPSTIWMRRARTNGRQRRGKTRARLWPLVSPRRN